MCFSSHLWELVDLHIGKLRTPKEFPPLPGSFSREFEDGSLEVRSKLCWALQFMYTMARCSRSLKRIHLRWQDDDDVSGSVERHRETNVVERVVLNKGKYEGGNRQYFWPIV